MDRRTFNFGLCGLVAMTFAEPLKSEDAAVSIENAVSEEELNAVYEEVKTPYKYGIVLDQLDGNLVDCPNIFRKDGTWYMVFISLVKCGYETFLAKSGDLLHWEVLGKIGSFPKTGWDAWQFDCGTALVDYTWGGSYEFQKFNDRYWFTYIGGSRQGYEPDPLSIGAAWCDDPTAAKELTRYEKNPIMDPGDASARWFEKTTLYKTHVIWDRQKTLGSPFVMYYNAKLKDTERIGMALSDDMLHWTRFGQQPVVDNSKGISGDPQITKIGDLWVMFYFGAFWKPKAFDTFAVSKDMVHWTKWDGPHLVEPSEPWDQTYAHKPWVLKHDGVVYHFYCAVGDRGRTIALATSQKLD